MSEEASNNSGGRKLNLDFSDIPETRRPEDRHTEDFQSRQIGQAEGFTSRQRTQRRRAQPRVQVNIKMAPNVHSRLMNAFNKTAGENPAVRNLGDFAAHLLEHWEKTND